MLNWDQREVLEKRLLIIAATLLHIAIACLIVEGLLVDKRTTQGTVIRFACDQDFSFFADTGEFEVTIQSAAGEYKRLAVPKSLCLGLTSGVSIRFVEGRISGLVYKAVIEKLSQPTKWRLLSVGPFVLVSLLFLAYVPAVLRNPVGRLGVLAICYLANRWLVAVI